MRLWLIIFVSVVVTAFAWLDTETIHNHGENYACMAQDKKMKNKTILLVNLNVQEHTSLSFD